MEEIIAKDLRPEMKVICDNCKDIHTILTVREEPWIPSMDLEVRSVFITTWDDGITRRFFMNNRVGILAE